MLCSIDSAADWLIHLLEVQLVQKASTQVLLLAWLAGGGIQADLIMGEVARWVINFMG